MMDIITGRAPPPARAIVHQCVCDRCLLISLFSRSPLHPSPIILCRPLSCAVPTPVASRPRSILCLRTRPPRENRSESG